MARRLLVEVVEDRRPEDFAEPVRRGLEKLQSDDPLERAEGQGMIDMSKTVEKVWSFYMDDGPAVTVTWVFEDPSACERMYGFLREVLVRRSAVRRGWRSVAGRRLPALTVDWAAWMLLREVFGALRDLGRVHPVDAVAERFVTAPPKEAAKQLARDLALLKLLGIGGE